MGFVRTSLAALVGGLAFTLPLPAPTLRLPTLRAPVVSAPGSEVDAWAELRAAGVQSRRWAPAAGLQAAGQACVVEDGALILRGGTGLRYSKPPRTSARFALRLARFEAIVQDEAQRILGQRVRRVDHLGSYVCRTIAGTRRLSKHGVGNALDVSAFVLGRGERVVVARDYYRDRPSGQFLRRIAQRARDERVFSLVLTPDHNARHHDHFHLEHDDHPWWRRLLSAMPASPTRGS